MSKRAFSKLFVVAYAALLAACGGGGGGGGGSIADAGIGGSGITSVGAVTAIGSITVNGVKFDTQGATVTVDDSPGAETDLQVGLVVSVTGTLNSDGVTGKATRIAANNELKGTVDTTPTITATGGTFTVFGQIVVVDGLTVFANATSLADFAAGTPVEVAGFRDSSGQVRATRVEKKAAVPATIEVSGTVSNVNNGASTFTLGSLTVNFGGAQRLNFPASGLTNGLLVEVKSASLPSAGVLTASSVEVKSGGLGQVTGEVRLEGLLTGLAGNTPVFTFNINGQPVSTNTATTYSGGTSAILANNTRVEVEGQIANGTLVAAKVKFEDRDSNVKITAQVTTKSATSTTLTVFALPSVSVTTNASTVFQDNSSQNLRVFGFANIQVNDWLEVEAAKDSTSAVTASKVVRVNTPSNSRAILQGPADSTTALPNIVILGVMGVTQTTTTYQDINGNPLNQTSFFSQVTTNSIVKMRGQFTGSAINPVDEAQLEN